MDFAPPPAHGAHPARRLAALTLALVGLTSCLIVLGALVRAHGAGLACPDWPLCFGQVVPEFDVKVAFEWSHRLVAGCISLLFVALCIAVLRRTGSALAWPIGVAAALLGLQVLLGALTVWELLARWTVTSHLVVGNSFNASLLWIALALRERATVPERVPVPSALRFAVAVGALLLLLQMVLGGLTSSGFAGLVCPEWPTCLHGEWFPTLRGPIGIHLAHRMNGYLLALALLGAALLSRATPQLRGPCGLAAALVGLQIGVGVANVLLEIPVEVTALHSALAAALVLTLTAATREVLRSPSPG